MSIDKNPHTYLIICVYYFQPTQLLHGEFNCFLGRDEQPFNIPRNNSIFYEKVCLAQLNVIGKYRFNSATIGDARCVQNCK